MISLFGRTIALASFLTLFLGFAVFLAFGGAVLLLPFLLVGLPVLPFVQRPNSDASAVWRSLPSAAKLEGYMSRLSEPVFITHRDSTEIIYANSRANEILGAPLVGRTAYTESDFENRPVKMDGSSYGAENHPAMRMKFLQKRKTQTWLNWRTPNGDLPVQFLVRQLSLSKGNRGDYLLVKVQLSEDDRAWLAGA